MTNEWRDNLWIVVSLTVVCIAIWGLSTIIYAKCKGLLEPRGFDPENVYSLSLKVLPSNSPAHVDTGEGKAGDHEDFGTILDNIRRNPHVQAVGWHDNGIVYYMSYFGYHFTPVEDSIEFMGNVRSMSPGMIEVLGIKSLTGKTTAQLTDMLKRGEILASNSDSYEKQERDPFKLVGQTVYFGNDTSKVYRVGDVIQSVRRSDYEVTHGGTIIQPINDYMKEWGDIAVRVKPGHARQFVEDFHKDKSLRQLRNVYFTDIQSLSQMRNNVQRADDIDIRLFFTVIMFLFITIFLGLLGTFHFRIMQRVKEVALRKVCGASRRMIFRRIISEGLLLLTVSALLASALMWPFANKYIDELDITWQACLTIEIISIFSMAVIIILGLTSPALRAMRIQPAEAVKEE